MTQDLDKSTSIYHTNPTFVLNITDILSKKGRDINFVVHFPKGWHNKVAISNMVIDKLLNLYFPRVSLLNIQQLEGIISMLMWGNSMIFKPVNRMEALGSCSSLLL